jgi:sugar porter (SP) family MFS transporter
VALYTVGCMFGALACFKHGDTFGRIRSTAAGCVLQIIGSILLCASFSLGQLIVGRLVLGLGMGIVSATVPVWQSESSPAKNRGALVVLQGAFASLGLATSQWVDLGLFFASGSVSWRFPLAFPIFFCLIVLCLLPFLPDSPRWMVKKGRIEEAKAVMAFLEDLEPDSEVIAESIRKMEVSLAETGKGNFRGLLNNGEERLLNRTLVDMFSTFSQQMNGIGIVGFYTTTLYEQYIGLTPLVSRILSGALFMFQLCCNVICFFVIDRIGRRRLMVFGTTGLGLSFIVLAGTVSHAQESKACSIIAAICVFLITFFFALGAHGINYLYGTEVAPLAYRVPIYALTTGTLWAFNFLVVEITPVGFAALGYKFFIVFAAINILLLTPGIITDIPYRIRTDDNSGLLFLPRDAPTNSRGYGCCFHRIKWLF